jgi:hypothetical protein
MGKEKKAFKDTIFGKIVGKAGNIIPDVVGVAAKVIQGNVGGAIDEVLGHLGKSGDPKAKGLITELTLERDKIMLEFSKVELEETKSFLLDIQDARANRKDSDWMFNTVTIFGLLCCAFIVYAITYVEVPGENKDLFIHLVGIVEGAIFLKIFTFFFGSSKGSKDKNDLMKKNF